MNATGADGRRLLPLVIGITGFGVLTFSLITPALPDLAEEAPSRDAPAVEDHDLRPGSQASRPRGMPRFGRVELHLRRRIGAGLGHVGNRVDEEPGLGHDQPSAAGEAGW